jgi:hypothetical protein
MFVSKTTLGGPRSFVEDFIETLAFFIGKLRPVETSLSGDFHDTRLKRVDRAIQN